ncbi:hypothetical protein FNV43_RR03215 [Rhamnella rubrinervis]|uniref:Uncharacterized protein n=1 Tax=Rhamnella rubrinervis TaxID=2594499 RepID=A0A8K0MNN9_9ROSA|nr:hypothetical protein FNV43_RR03215 [Rhamnella rubrinervis]
MDIRDRRKNSEKNIFSVLQANEYFVKKILSRNPSVGGGQSSRFYHSRVPGQVPFKWELLPGKPKDILQVPEDDYIPVIGPPPAIRSQDLPRPHSGSTGTGRFRLRFWKRFMKNQYKLRKLKPSLSWDGADRHDHLHDVDDHHDAKGLKKFGSKPTDDSFDEYLTSSSCTSSSSPSSSTASSSSSLGVEGGQKCDRCLMHYMLPREEEEEADEESSNGVDSKDGDQVDHHRHHHVDQDNQMAGSSTPTMQVNIIKRQRPRKEVGFRIVGIQGDMYGSQFDGSNAFSGGGFMPSQATQAHDPAFSPAKNRDVQALLPLTVKQINDACISVNEKSEFVIDGVDVNNVKLVGIVRDKAGRVTDVTFVLDDGTGRIDCSKWFHEAIDTNEMEGILDGMYVCVHGRLKSFQGKRTLNVFSIRPVEDYNEIASHFIECIYVHFYNSRLRKPQGGVNTQPQVVNSTNLTSGQYSSDGQKRPEEMILELLHQPSFLAREEGAHRDIISQQLKIPVDKIMLAIGNLVAEGMVYSTVDDYHYKSSING